MGLGCPVADLLTRAGVGEIGIIEYDKINLSNIHRQTLFSAQDVGKFKIKIAKKANLINKEVKIKTIIKKLKKKILKKIINEYEIIVDGVIILKQNFY